MVIEGILVKRVREKVYVPNVLAMKIFLLLKKYWLNHELIQFCQIIWNGLIWVGVIWINVNRFRIFVIPNFRTFVPNFFNFKIIFALTIFENFVASKVFTFNFRCTMPWQSPVGKAQNPDYQVEDVEAPITGPGNIWAWDYYGSWWVHPNFVIRVPPKIKNHFFTTFPTPKG